jgi:hypothetical protein
MKTFYEWLELNEAGFFGNLFGKKAQPTPASAPTPTPAPAPAPAPEKKGMDLDDFRRLMDGPDYDPARYAPKKAQEAEPAPKADSRLKLTSSPQNPEEYIEEVANKYWRSDDRNKYLFDKWNNFKQQTDNQKKIDYLHAIYYSLAIQQRSGDEESKRALIKLLEKFGLEAFPAKDEVELGHELRVDYVRFLDPSRYTPAGVVRVIAKGFWGRRGDMYNEAIVDRKYDRK